MPSIENISNLEPAVLWKFFQKICDIPHPSGYEEKLASFIVEWAKSKQLWVERDLVGNILIRKKATRDMMGRKNVLLQAHLDMVPQKNNNVEHDFTKDAIKPLIDGDWVRADGTTLGSDNGIGLASILAILDSDDIPHPNLEALFTVTEESGMIGANSLKKDWLHSSILINTDTEESGEIYIGCAGGMDVDITMPISQIPNNMTNAKLLILKGLKGGHSGCDIHTGRGNAIKLLARVLAELRLDFDFSLSNINGGSIRNAIPREASAILVFHNTPAFLEKKIKELEIILKKELKNVDSNIQLSLQEVAPPSHIYLKKDSEQIINLLNALPNGVIQKSNTINDVIETSLNVGIVYSDENKFNIMILIRSLNESGKKYVFSILSSLVELSKAHINLIYDCPGWTPDSSSHMVPISSRLYESIIGKPPKIKVLHASLECGLIKKIYPDLDMISIGPTIRNAHSPDEKVNILTVSIYWELLKALLSNIPLKS